MGAVDPQPRASGVVSRSRAQRHVGPNAVAAAVACKPGQRANPATLRSGVARAGGRRSASSALAPILSVDDEEQQEIVLLGVDRADLVFRYRTRSTAWRLDQPDLRVFQALQNIGPRDSLDITVRGAAERYRVTLNGAPMRDLGFTAGRGWGILLYPEHLPPWLARLLDACWLAGLLAPVGLCARSRPALWGGGAMLVSLGVLPPLVGLLPSPISQWGGAILGVGVGTLLRRRAYFNNACSGTCPVPCTATRLPPSGVSSSTAPVTPYAIACRRSSPFAPAPIPAHSKRTGTTTWLWFVGDRSRGARATRRQSACPRDRG